MTFLSWEVVGNADVETTNGQVSRPNGYLTTIFLPLTMYKPLGSCERCLASPETLAPWMVKIPLDDDVAAFCTLSIEEVIF